MLNKTITLTAGLALALAISPTAQATLIGQLGLLDLEADYGYGAGVNPGTGMAWAAGDKYRLAFTTDAETTGDLATVDAYNIFVTNDAAGGTAYTNLKDVTWKAIVGHDDNAGTVTTPQDNLGGPFADTTPVFRLDSVLVGQGKPVPWTGWSAMWSGSGDNKYTPKITPDGSSYGGAVFTGCDRNPSSTGGRWNPLGPGDDSIAGASYGDDGYHWVAQGNSAKTNELPIFGISEDLTVQGDTGVIPEPSTCVIWALGLLGLGWYGRRRRR